ncbi:MAG: adenosylmethionine decarboxylase [bacterium]
MNSLGRHILAEFYDCDPEMINDPGAVERVMREAAEISGATIVQSIFHMFSPHGVSGVVVVAESHLAVHTWPEYGYAAVDYFSCGPVDSAAAVLHLRGALGAETFEMQEIARGALLPAAAGCLPELALLRGAGQGAAG